MASKRDRLAARASETARRPHPERLVPRKEKRGYRVIAVSLYSDQANWLDAEVERLGSKRSTVVQHLIDAARRTS
jgi:hypothetical protein